MSNRRAHGDGSITQRADGRWQGCKRLGVGQNGKAVRKYFYGDSKKDVAQKMKTWETENAGPGRVDPSALTIEQVAADWLSTRHKEKSPTTTARRTQIVRDDINPHLGTVKVQKLEPWHVRKMLEQLESKGAWAQKMAYQVLRTLLTFASKEGLIRSFPWEKIETPRPAAKELPIYGDADLRKILAAAREKRLHALFVLAATTGMRQGELLGLSWEDVDLAGGIVHVRRALIQVGGKFQIKSPKSKAGRRSIAIPAVAVDALQQHRAAMFAEGRDVRTGTVFVSREGTFIGNTNLIRYVWKPLTKSAGVAYQPFHSLRHSHASSLLRSGTNIRAVSKRLGHADPAMTLRVYAHVLPDEDAKVAAAVQSLLA